MSKKSAKSAPKLSPRKSKKQRELAAALGAPEAEQAAAEAALEQESEEQAYSSLPPIPPPPEWVAPIGPPEIPSAWADGGYLALVTNFHGGVVTFISSSSGGESSRLDLPKFWRRIKPHFPAVDPTRCILSFLARERSGLFNMRVRDIRRLIEMLTKESLEKMSERDLGNEYRKLVDPKGPQRIKTDKKAEFIQKILDAAKEMGAKVDADGTPKPPKEKKVKPPTEPKPPKEKKVKEPKPPKEPKTPKQPKTPKAPKQSAKEIKAAGGNPFREGSMKNKAFSVYLATKGDREKTIEAATKAGATPSTASSWYAAFNKL